MSDFDLIRQARQQYQLEQRIGQTEVREIPAAIVARYTTAAGQSFNNGATAIVDFGTVVFDTHSRVTTGAAWKFTANEAGYYGVAASILFASSTAWADAEAGLISLYKNGALYSHLHRKDSYGSASPVLMMLSGGDVLSLAAGDSIDVRAFQNTGGSLALFADASFNYINIWKL